MGVRSHCSHKTFAARGSVRPVTALTSRRRAAGFFEFVEYEALTAIRGWVLERKIMLTMLAGKRVSGAGLTLSHAC